MKAKTTCLTVIGVLLGICFNVKNKLVSLIYIVNQRCYIKAELKCGIFNSLFNFEEKLSLLKVHRFLKQSGRSL